MPRALTNSTELVTMMLRHQAVCDLMETCSVWRLVALWKMPLLAILKTVMYLQY